MHSNVVGALALGLEEANRSGGGGRHGAVQHEEALCWRRDGIRTPKASLSKPLPLSKAVVPIKGVGRVHGKRRDAQPRVCRLDKVAVAVGKEWQRQGTEGQLALPVRVHRFHQRRSEVIRRVPRM